MDDKKFNEAQVITETIAKLHLRALHLVEIMSEGTITKVTVEYYTGKGKTRRLGSIYLNNVEDLRNIMQKEYDDIQIDLVELRKQFKEL